MGRGRVVPATFWPDFPALSRARGVMLGAKCWGWDAWGAVFTLRPPPASCLWDGRRWQARRDPDLMERRRASPGDEPNLHQQARSFAFMPPPFWPPAVPLGAAGLWEALLLRELGAVSLLRCPWVISLQLRSDTIAMVMTQRHSEALLSLAKSISLRSISQISPHPLEHSVAISELLTSPFQPGVSLSSAAPGHGSSASIPVPSSSPASSCAFTSQPSPGFMEPSPPLPPLLPTGACLLQPLSWCLPAVSCRFLLILPLSCTHLGPEVAVFIHYLTSFLGHLGHLG